MKRLLFVLLLLLSGCADTPPTAAPAESPPFTLPPGFSAEALPTQFTQPTQFFVDEENQLWVAEINGPENAEAGRVVRIDLATGEQTVVATDLDKPTGIALLGDTLWVAARNTLVKVDSAEGPDSAIVAIDNLAFNGRSNGTLTVTPDGKLLATTTGRSSDPNSGRLWTFDPINGALDELASGLKNAYAHVYDADGRLWMTEIGDGSLDGVAYPGEVNYGWPTCYGRELAGTDCDDVVPAVAVLPDHATPTGIAVSPFEPDTLLVALWLTGEVVAVDVSVSAEGEGVSGAVAPFISEMANPQHLVTMPDGTLWVSEYATGKIWIVERE